MRGSEKEETQPLEQLKEERDSGSPRHPFKGSAVRPASGPHHPTRRAGCPGRFPAASALQLVSLLLVAGILVTALVRVPKVLSSREQETIEQELIQLGRSVARLCRRCPWDWTSFQGRCYFFSKSKRNWTASAAACQEVGAQLLIVQRAEEQSFLQNLPKRKGLTWIGLSDLKEEGRWRWVDGSPLPSSLEKYWQPGQPDNDRNQDCVGFKDDGWNDLECDLKFLWACKKPAASCPNT